MLNQLNQKDKLLETKRADIEEYTKLKENFARGKKRCEKMIKAVSLHDAKTLLKA